MRNVLTPDEVELVVRVTNEASEALHCDEAMKAVIAERIVSFANRGERRYATLLAIALDETDVATSRQASLSTKL